MNNSSRLNALVSWIALCGLSGCAVTTPALRQFGGDEAVHEEHLVGYAKCQIHLAVQQVLADQAADIKRLGPGKAYLAGNSLDWLRGWGATVNMKIIVDEKVSLAPNLSFNHTLENVVSVFSKGGNVTNGQGSATTVGASVTSDATRTENIGFIYAFSDLLAEPDVTPQDCQNQRGLFIDSDLKFNEFLHAKTLLAKAPETVSETADTAPFTTFTYEVQFVVTRSANVNPSWKLVNISINPAASLLSGARARTDDLLITLGKVTKKAGETPEPSQEVRDAHLAALIGQAVASSIQSQQH